MPLLFTLRATDVDDLILHVLGEKIKYVRVDNEKEEASYVAKEIKKLLSEEDNPSEIAVLYRTNAQSRVFEETLLSNPCKNIFVSISIIDNHNCP